MAAVQEPILLVDPSDKYRPEYKEEKEFRNYFSGKFQDRVQKSYDDMHTNQSYEFAKAKKDAWCKFDHAEISIMEAVDALDNMIDQTDPDIGLPNSIHSYQTAERCRAAHPDKDWLHFTGLIHDLGKVMAEMGEPQWAVTGDTFPLGCAFSDKIVFGKESFKKNPDYNHPVYSTRLGVYEENCGLENVLMSWGHDEYMYQVLKNIPGSPLPDEALYMIRFHSFYPWHTAKQYDYLCNDKDRRMLPWVLEFNKFDLYSKCEDVPDVAALKPYYQGLIDKYLPGKIRF